MNGFTLEIEAINTWIGFAWLLAISAALISYKQLKSEQTQNRHRQLKLRTRYEKLFRQHAVKLKISKKQTSQLESALTKLRKENEASEEKNIRTYQLLTNMSHEIRSPLNAIIGFTELMLMSPAKANLENLKHIQTAGNHLMNLINDILDLSHIESNSFHLNEQSFELHSLLDECCQMMMPELQDTSVYIQPSFHDSVNCEITFDKMRLTQIIINLLSNAVKYTPSGYISLSGRLENHDNNWFLHLAVQDTGLGMSEDQVAQIFKPHTQFHQDHESLIKTGIQSTGLGLAITDQLIRHMAGEIQIHSTPNVGTDIQVKLPVKPPLSVNTVRPEKDPSIADDMVAEQTLRYPVLKAPYQPVLLVDDQVENLKLVECYMQKLGVEYVSCGSGIEALNLFKKSEFSFVFMDIRMPLMDGIETVQFMRQKPEHKCTFIALSANAMASEITTALEAGFDQYLTKPLSIHALNNIFTIQASIEIAEPAGIYWPKALEITGQDKALAVSMIEQLLERIPEMVKELDSCNSYQDFDSEILHKWQGLISYAGAVRLNKLMASLERSIADANNNVIKAINKELIKELHLVMAHGLNTINRERGYFSAITVATA